jgi:molybdate transport system substrate-binding protein
LNVLYDLKPGRIVIADPEATLSGVHAKQAMTRIGVWQKISFKVRFCANQQAAAQELLDSGADAAVLYLSTVVQTPGIEASMTFPKDSYLSIVYFGAPLKASPHAKRAYDFMVRLAGPASGPIWMDNGFNPPPAGMP